MVVGGGGGGEGEAGRGGGGGGGGLKQSNNGHNKIVFIFARTDRFQRNERTVILFCLKQWFKKGKQFISVCCVDLAATASDA